MQEVRKLAADRPFSEVAMLAVAAVSRDHPTWYRLRYELYALSLRNPDFLPAVGNMLEKGRQGIAQAIREGTAMDEAQAEAMAAIFHACTDGLALQQLAQPDLDLAASYRLVQSLLTVKRGDED
jgi:hypothetical protein